LNDNVFINNTMSAAPPSIGMATFDGLDYTGTPYNTGYGSSDVLTSAYLDLSDTTKTAYLSYYMQPKGLGFCPDPKTPFILEFKTADNKWNIIIDSTLTKYYYEEQTAPPFKQYAFKIAKKYLYKGFQFRFRAFGKRSGVTDIWNLDYVRISDYNPQVDKKPAGFSDLAFTQQPGSILKNYTAAPWKHIKGFEVQELKTDLEVELYNHFNIDQKINNSNASIVETKTGTTLIDNYSYFTKISNLNISPFSFKSDREAMLKTQSDILFDKIKQIPATAENLAFVKTLSIDVFGAQDKDYAAVSRNDKISSTTVCSNYFAYDDGTAEVGYSLQGTETQLQVRFRTNVDDSLRAVLFHFPHYQKDLSTYRFNLRVFVGDLGKTPTYEKLYLKPQYPDKYIELLQGFTQYILTDADDKPKALYIPKGVFYIGVQQVTTGEETLVIGFDKNNPQAGVNNFVNKTGIWKAIVGSKGAFMIRPKLSSIASQVLASEEQSELKAAVFPNPANDFLNINLEDASISDFTYSIFDLSGKVIQEGKVAETIDIQYLMNGMYIIKIQNSKGNKAYRQKISIIK
jgi:Secretion system C-terminal sorting domain